MKAPSRPRLDLERSGLETAMGAVGLLGLVVLVVQQHRLARGLLIWMKTQIAWMLAGIQWGTVQAALYVVRAFRAR